MNPLPGQLELMTVIARGNSYYPEYLLDETGRSKVETILGAGHSALRPSDDTYKPAGVRLAKMLAQYEDQPSSQLWADIQRLAREILK